MSPHFVSVIVELILTVSSLQPLYNFYPLVLWINLITVYYMPHTFENTFDYNAYCTYYNIMRVAAKNQGILGVFTVWRAC